MSRINELFKKKQKGVLSIFCTAGYPHLDSTLSVLKALEKYGADMVELGMPYSDPLADGPVIQKSSALALKNGMTMNILFEQLASLRKEISIPVVLMGYLNPVLQYGFERFSRDAAAVGIDGLIIPDLPAHEFETTYGPILARYGLDFVFLVTPETPPDRVKMLDSLSNGFLYAVSSSSTTGKEQKSLHPGKYLESLQQLHLSNPVLVGFGIRNKDDINEITKNANGVIIGSAFIKALEGSTNPEKSTKEFLGALS